jgi:hypothetical protein
VGWREEFATKNSLTCGISSLFADVPTFSLAIAVVSLRGSDAAMTEDKTDSEISAMQPCDLVGDGNE